MLQFQGPNMACRGHGKETAGQTAHQADLHPQHQTSHLCLSPEEATAPRPTVAHPDPNPYGPVLSFISAPLSFCQNPSTTASEEINGNLHDKSQDAKLDFTRLWGDRDNLELNMTHVINSNTPEIILVRIKALIYHTENYLCSTKNNLSFC